MPTAWPLLHKITKPCGIIVGSDDNKFRNISDEALRLLPLGSLWVIPQAGHCAHLEQPDHATQAMNEFIEKIAAFKSPARG